MGFLSRFRKNGHIPVAVQVHQQAKMNLLKDKELAFEVLSENLKGKKLCPLMMGAPCMGDACMLFQEYVETEKVSGIQRKFKACSLSQANAIAMETNFNVMRLHNSLVGIAQETAEEIKNK